MTAEKHDIRPLETIEQVSEASAVLDAVWGGDRGGMPTNLLQALATAGNYAVAVYADGRMVGASVAFFAAPAARSMHSHVTGVLRDFQSRGLGRALKQHQREWARENGIEHITWTFDPLVARNAHMNLAVLGVQVTDYLVDHYGAMDDGVNRGDETDRLMVSWAVSDPEGVHKVYPVDPRSVVATVGVPADIEALRRTAASEAASWRTEVRRAMRLHLADGLVIGGFDDHRGYLFVRP